MNMAYHIGKHPHTHPNMIIVPLAGSDLSSSYAVGLTPMRKSICGAAFRTRSGVIYRLTYQGNAQTANVSACFMFGTLAHRLTLSVQRTDVSVELWYCHIMRSDTSVVWYMCAEHKQSRQRDGFRCGGGADLVNSRALTAMLYAICLLGPSCN